MGLKKFMAAALAASMLLAGCAKNDGAGSSSGESSEIIKTEETVGAMERTYEAEEHYVKLLGRPHNENGILW
ncbi:MAG: hypothetical protein K2G32_03010, partial [Oscillospiraceae bacterium]|nr:hypothetical protein [Oscillospiraceae bacterium]